MRCRFLSISILLICSIVELFGENNISLGSEYWIERYLSVSYPLKDITITSNYGNRKDPFTGKKIFHNGLDLKADYEQARSMFSGVVEAIGEDSRSGKYVKMQYGEITVSYCHLFKITVEQGDSIDAGDMIGITGNSGRSTGPHLHLTAIENGKTINPYKLLLFIKNIRKEACLALGGDIREPLSPNEFIRKYADLAMMHQRKFGIPASVTLAQMALESSWGNSTLALDGKNYFGIKATKEWIESGRPYSLHDDDRKKEPFCNYDSVEESVAHHSKCLMSKRYRKCRSYSQTDYHNWLKELKAAGYATAADYVGRCERIIKKYKLYLFDQEVASEENENLERRS